MIVKIKMITLAGQAMGPSSWRWCYDGVEYQTEAEALAARDAPSQDEQEALSVRYAQGLWVVPLSSGAWAIFGTDRKLITIEQELDEAKLRHLDFVQGQQWTQAQLEGVRQRASSAPVQLANQSPEDLDL